MLFCNLVYVTYFLLTILLLVLIFDNVNGELKDSKKEEHRHENNEEIYLNEHQRRVLDAIDDKEWHVSHLKGMDFETNCEEETFSDKVKRYRKTLKNDGALVEFVSADAIPVNKQDLEKDKCISNLKSKKENTVNSFTDIGVKEKSVNTSDDIKPATVSVKDLEDSVANIMTDQRRSEYQFSSVEYYDETQDFNAGVCPDEVEVIQLELDTLRSYDVVCEATLEWRSLE
ncbi:uncharacterized protein LOC123864358 [Maniola jurtina]|uniref:uncharacterized protein LOC123864358 n=1 Tax=Maniola jurtina TaxID=191418 RepID=UPI001E68F6FB|nr:uncharacterized protein LOC123864358 [Maniola jurtina]